MRLNGARMVVEALRAEKVDTVFCFPGAAVIPIYDELYLHGNGVRLVQPRHEQAGVHAADGYARVSGRTGVVLVTSGPGASNTVTGIATAAADSTPMVIITGQVGQQLVGTDAFQEVNITGMVMPVAKEVIFVNAIDALSKSLTRAFYLAATGRKGPVLVDITKNVLTDSARFKYSKHPSIPAYRCHFVAKTKSMEKLQQLVASSKRPLILAGAGVAESGAEQALTSLVEMTGIPVVRTLRAPRLTIQDKRLSVGVLSSDDKRKPPSRAEFAYSRCDILIVLGARFSDPSIGTQQRSLSHANVAHVDIDPTEIGKKIQVDLPIVSDVCPLIKSLQEVSRSFPDFCGWVQEIQLQPIHTTLNQTTPHFVLKILSAVSTIFNTPILYLSASIYKIKDVIHCLDTNPFEKIVSATGNGAGEFALPAAIGAAIANPEKDHVVICDVIELSRSLPELVTIYRENTNIKIIVFDDVFDEKLKAHLHGSADHIDWVGFFKRFQFEASCMHHEDEIQSKLQFLKSSTKPILLQVKSLTKQNFNKENEK